jgi:hypothetical protein
MVDEKMPMSITSSEYRIIFTWLLYLFFPAAQLAPKPLTSRDDPIVDGQEIWDI